VAAAAAAALLCLSGRPAAAVSGEGEEGWAVYAIQPRLHLLAHEFSLSIGFLPLDAFYKYFTVAGAYTYHFNEFWAWEVGKFIYGVPIATKLEDTLEERWSVQPNPESLDEVKFFLGSSLVVKPAYGKIATFNSKILFAELYFTLGGGIAKLDTPGFRPMIIPGVGLRFFAGKFVSVRFDIRDYLYFEGVESVTNHLYVGLGMSLNLGGELRRRRMEAMKKPDKKGEFIP